jgi:hypothetical protein
MASLAKAAGLAGRCRRPISWVAWCFSCDSVEEMEFATIVRLNDEDSQQLARMHYDYVSLIREERCIAT